jgi:type II secretory pathway pseudopilin PulG
MPELLVVILLLGVVMLVAALSIGRAKASADEMACKDNMSAIHSALQVYWAKNADPVTHERSYPATQAEFETFLQTRAYFTEEPRCPLDEGASYHYLYSYDPAVDPGPEGITITCPVPDSDHGSL